MITGIYPQSRSKSEAQKFARDVNVWLSWRQLPNHPRRNEIMLPVLLVAVLPQMLCQLGPVPDSCAAAYE
jgi:hypothetical protein